MGKDQGQDSLTRWHFVHLADGGVPSAVFAPFVTTVLTPMLPRLNPSFQWTQLIWRVITDPLAAQASYATGFPLTGSNAGGVAPSYVAISAKWTFGATVVLTAETPQRRIRRGGKRIGGVPAGSVASNLLTSGLASIWAGLLQNYVGMSDGAWLPCIAGFPKQPPRGTDPDDPLLGIPNKYALINGVVVNPALGSQVSRKVNHGN